MDICYICKYICICKYNVQCVGSETCCFWLPTRSRCLLFLNEDVCIYIHIHMPSLDQTACNHACFGTSCLIHIYSETFAEILKKLHCRCTELRHCLQDHTSMLICAFRQAADICLDMHVCGTICTVRHHVYTRFSIPLHAAILYY